MKKITLLFAVSMLLFSCAPKEKRLTLVDSNGLMNQVLVVMDYDSWKGVEGQAVKNVINERVVGLPQKEPHLDAIQIPTNAFKNLFLSQKSILHVSIGDKNEFTVRTDVYARPQKIITITATDSESLIKEINNRKDEILTTFRDFDIKATQYRLLKKQFNTKKSATLYKLGISMQIPSKYRMVDDTGDFLWLRQHLHEGQSMNLLIYELPINSVEDEEGKNINSVRDTIGKKFIPGQFEGSYYITEQAFTPITNTIEMAGLKTYETRGKWEVKNDFMAGPFLNYTLVDKVNNRLIVLEGFAYAPAVNKRNYMFEIEAVLKTLKLNPKTD
ncbi:MAG: DUF4837 domain-containing protein [Flavobacteriaceae bacterium]|nr:MAG: DUF4837 domain-containing protein [Flavobacteriaceae bacterium]